jgi:hypothetical protein
MQWSDIVLAGRLYTVKLSQGGSASYQVLDI